MTRTANCSRRNFSKLRKREKRDDSRGRRKDLRELPTNEVVLPCLRKGRCVVTRGSSRAGYRGDKKNALLTARDIEAMHSELIAEWEYVRDYDSD
jgi:hypothetical protein